MELNWGNNYDNAFQQEPVRNNNYQPIPTQHQSQLQSQSTQQLMPNVYQPNIPEEEIIEHFTQENEDTMKKYIEMFVIICIVYFILSLDSVKDSIGKILTCINTREDGSISKWGYFAYSVVLSAIVCGVFYLVDNYVSLNF